MLTGKIALVTGANGFVGSHTVRLLLDNGFAVRGMVRASSDMSRLNGLDVARVNIDLADPASMNALPDALNGVSLVVHTAAYVDLGTVDRPLMRRVNLDGTRALLDAAEAAEVPSFVYCSTVRTLGDTGGIAVDGDHVRTDRDFSSCYDETKTKAEAMVLARNHPGLATYSVLPPAIFGHDDPHFGQALRAFLAGHLPFWPAQDRPLGMVHVDDLAKLFLLAAQRGAPGTRYIASAGEMTMGEIFGILSELTGRRQPSDLPEILVRAAAEMMDILGRVTKRNMVLNRERAVFLYDKVVRTDPSRTLSELGWTPRAPREILSSIVIETQK